MENLINEIVLTTFFFLQYITNASFTATSNPVILNIFLPLVNIINESKKNHWHVHTGNLLLAECGRVKIADLGVCNEFMGEDASMNNGAVGTPAFRSPETLLTGQVNYMSIV